MTECTFDSSVPDWVIEHPVALAVFQTLGIDYCCGGKSLEFACREQGLDAAAVLKTLLRALEVNRDDDSDLGKKLGQQLKELISIVTYQPFLRWVREAEAAHTAKKATPKRKPGRPRMQDDIGELVLRLARVNSWGYTRILGELQKLGIRSISRQTVKVILKGNDIDPGPTRGKGTWDEFLKIHAETLWQCDFVSKPMWTTRGLVDLYFLVGLHLGTRRCWISPYTLSPDSGWVSQQARNFMIEAEDAARPAEIVMRDNDTKYSRQFDEVFKSSGVTVQRTTPVSPNLWAHVERFTQTLKVECLDKFVIVAERHLNHVNREWRLHYNRERPHTARGHLPPGMEQPLLVNEAVRLNDIVYSSRLGGLLKHNERRAA
jgi:putative transposase